MGSGCLPSRHYLIADLIFATLSAKKLDRKHSKSSSSPGVRMVAHEGGPTDHLYDGPALLYSRNNVRIDQAFGYDNIY